MKGPKAVLGKIWTSTEDSICFTDDNEKMRDLKGKRGDEAILKRLQFLTELGAT